MPAVRVRGVARPRRGWHLRDRRRPRSGGGRGRQLPGGRGSEAIGGQEGDDQPRAGDVRPVAEHRPADQDRAPPGRPQLPVLQAAQVRVARGRARHPDDEPVRAERRPGVAPRGRPAELRRPGEAARRVRAGKLQQVPAQVPAEGSGGGLRVHGLPGRPGDHQGDGRHGQGPDAVREIHRALTDATAGWKIVMTTYLDNAATSFPKPEAVYQAMDRFARSSLANPGRAGHKMALAAEHALDDGRHRLNRFFNGKGPDRFVFTLNCTDALNMAFKGVLQAGDHVITTDLEHNSVSRPLRAMELANHITLRRVKADASGTVDPEAIRKAITPKTRMIAVGHASNVIGTVQPVAEIGLVARERDVLFLVDCAQTAGVLPIDIQALHIDLLAFPGHKGLMGPTGTGALYVS